MNQDQNQPHVGNEVIFAFVAAVGVDLTIAENAVEKNLANLGYQVIKIRVTRDVFPQIDDRASRDFEDYYASTITMMDIGDDARKSQKIDGGPTRYDIVALGIAKAIQSHRVNIKQGKKTAFLVHSLKHPHEVHALRNMYQRGFYLIGVHAPAATRKAYLKNDRKLSSEKVDRLMDRDRQEKVEYGQKLVDTFHLADVFFGHNDGRNVGEKLKYTRFVENNVERFIEIVFSHPNRTPTFGEYAMFLAFSASLRSADLSRQVGAVITRGREILGTGANDCPKAGGGLYWPTLNIKTLLFEDVANGRDYKRGEDSNRKELNNIKKQVIDEARTAFQKVFRKQIHSHGLQEEATGNLTKLLLHQLSHILEDSPISDLTEFGRVVHAEMEALLSCARKGISTIDSTIFSTTFPCHNCAKHIIAAGIKRVVFIQPYLKSKALDMYEDDSIEISYATPLAIRKHTKSTKVRFEPFVGVGPRRFLDLFSMDLGVGTEMKRKETTGKAKKWSGDKAKIRIEMAPNSYFERENDAAKAFDSGVSRYKLSAPASVNGNQ